MTILERLENSLNEKDNQIEELNNKIEEYKQKELQDEWSWRQFKKLSEEENLGLPIPRLEIRNIRISEYNLISDYNLVLKHFLGHILCIPIGSTRRSGSNRVDLETPLRDGAHIINDMKQLNLRAFVVNEAKYKEIFPT